jgi:LmbE family N-acetylglucosaminyl deacetylase
VTVPVALAVSPHLDDAVFSAGGTLAALADTGWRVVVATVFTANVERPKGFALACQLDKGLAADVDYMALRRAEDRAACAIIGAEPAHLPLVEAPHRGYASAAELFGAVRAGDDPPVAPLLARLIERLRPQRILGPQAIGGHVDHVLTRRALERLGQPWESWADWPYADRSPPSAPGHAVDRARKLDACAAYASQLGFQFGGLDGLSTRLGDREWVLPIG